MYFSISLPVAAVALVRPFPPAHGALAVGVGAGPVTGCQPLFPVAITAPRCCFDAKYSTIWQRLTTAALNL